MCVKHSNPEPWPSEKRPASSRGYACRDCYLEYRRKSKEKARRARGAKPRGQRLTGEEREARIRERERFDVLSGANAERKRRMRAGWDEEHRERHRTYNRRWHASPRGMAYRVAYYKYGMTLTQIESIGLDLYPDVKALLEAA